MNFPNFCRVRTISIILACTDTRVVQITQTNLMWLIHLRKLAPVVLGREGLGSPGRKRMDESKLWFDIAGGNEFAKGLLRTGRSEWPWTLTA